MALEEYETIRLIDYEGLTQEECSERMNVARTTVQRIYSDARKKMAQLLVEGRSLRIEGGDYKLYDENEKIYGCGRCRRHRPVSYTHLSLPFVISGSIPSLVDAFFETMSGFTTTGSTLVENIEILPRGILFWRSFTNWIGGMGILVFTVAILPTMGIGGFQIFKAESTGPIALSLIHILFIYVC